MLLVALVVGLVLGATGGTAAPGTPKVAWSPCHAEFGPFECGTVQVPLDYHGPDGGTISIAVVRLPASDPAHRIGSLFINPGGPGGSGFDFALFAAPILFNAEVRARFDIVGFDPRGVIRSSPLRCFDNDKQWAPFFTPFAFPVTPAEAIWEDADRFLTAQCDQRGAVVGNLYDPATPYHGAVHVASLLPNSRLLTVAGWGHTSLFLSQCADAAIDHYLLTSVPPPSGTVCSQDVVPFAG